MNDKLGKFGLLTCKFLDSLSVIIDNIANNVNYNTIGFYYFDYDDYKILLLNVYDGFNIKNIYSISTMKEILLFNYINKIICYSLDDDYKSINFQQNYNREFNFVNNSSKNNLEEKFINIISGLDISLDHKHNRDYQFLLDKINTNEKIGNNIIIKILFLLDNNIINNFIESTLIKNIITLYNKCNNCINFKTDNIDNEIIRFKKYNIVTNTTINNSNDPKADNIYYQEMENIGKCLVKTINSTSKLEQCLEIKNMIAIYNNLFDNKIESNDIIDIMIHPDIIIPQSPNIEIISIISSNINSKNKTDLTVLSDIQLFDLLIYIDSYRDSLGINDNRFSGIQNLITKELSIRNKSSNI